MYLCFLCSNTQWVFLVWVRAVRFPWDLPAACSLFLYSVYISVKLLMFLVFILGWVAPSILLLMKWFWVWEITKPVNNDNNNYNPYILLTLCQILLDISSLVSYQNNPMGNIILTLRQRCESEWEDMMCPKSYSYWMANGNFPLLLD